MMTDLSTLTEDELTRAYTAVIEALDDLNHQTTIQRDDPELCAEEERLNAQALDLHLESTRRLRYRRPWESLMVTTHLHIEQTTPE